MKYSFALLFVGALGLAFGGCESSTKHPKTDCEEAAGCGNGSPDTCVTNADCKTSKYGELCVEGACTPRCDSHFDCSSMGVCAVADPPHCEAGDPAKTGQFYQHCSGGTSDCDTTAGFLCLGAGVGDIDAYCTADCKEDGVCPSGFR